LSTVILLSGLLQAGVVFAAQDLLNFTSSLKSFSADFVQTVYDSDSVALHESEGSVELLRPGKFRWIYSEPTRQVIVADGLTLWVYDQDIDQVTMQPQAETLGSAPIGLLSGQRSLQREFEITELGIDNGLRWYQLEPLVQDTDFHKVFLALDEQGLRAMELRDNFDQATQIRFDNFRKNIDVDAGKFAFIPPDGVDILGEPGVAEENPLQSGQQSLESQPAAEQQPVIESQPEPDPLLVDQQPDPLLEDLDDATASPQATAASESTETENPSQSDENDGVLQQGSETFLQVIESKPVQ